MKTDLKIGIPVLIAILLVTIPIAIVDWQIINTLNITKSPSFKPQYNPFSLAYFALLVTTIWAFGAWLYWKGGGNGYNAFRIFLTGIIINVSGINNLFYYWFGGLTLKLPHEWPWLHIQSRVVGHNITTPELALICLTGLVISIVIWLPSIESSS